MTANAWGRFHGRNDIANVTELIDRRKLGAFQKRVAFLCALVAAMEGFNIQSVGFIATGAGAGFSPHARESWTVLFVGLVRLVAGGDFCSASGRSFRQAATAACLRSPAWAL